MRLAQRVTELAPSATLEVTAQAARLKADGVDVISFGAGEPDFDTPAHIKRACIAAIEGGQTKYSKPASGSAESKRAVCAKLARENGLEYGPEQVVVTSGGKMAFYLAAHALLDPGDEVIIPVPYWVSYPEIVKLAGGVPVFVTGSAANDFRLTPDVLSSALTARTRMFIINSPSNPSGVTYSPDELKALGDALRGRDLVAVSDEIYDQLVYDGQTAMSFAAVSDEVYAKTVTINSASKTYAMTGWRLGYAAGPRDLIAAMCKLQSQSTSGAVTFNQPALAEALSASQACVAEMRIEFARRGKHMWERLSAISGVTCPKPTGAFFCFPNMSRLYTRLGVGGSVEFARRMLEEVHVAVVPGVAFGMDAHTRFSFATSIEQIDAGLDRIERWIG